MTRHEALETLLGWLLAETWDHGVLDIDGGDLQDKLLELGLIYEDVATEADVGDDENGWTGFEGEVGDPIMRRTGE